MGASVAVVTLGAIVFDRRGALARSAIAGARSVAQAACGADYRIGALARTVLADIRLSTGVLVVAALALLGRFIGLTAAGLRVTRIDGTGILVITVRV